MPENRERPNQVEFTRETLKTAFAALGRTLAERGLFVEIGVYGGGAVIMQFEWRRTTLDVDAVARPGSNPRALQPAVVAVAEELGFDEDWLNDAVGMFTPLQETEELFLASGTYPSTGAPGLRVLLARPRYLLAMKLQALASLDRDERDMDDARGLARHLGLTDEQELVELYRSIYDEPPVMDARRRFAQVLA